MRHRDRRKINTYLCRWRWWRRWRFWTTAMEV